MDSVPLSSSPSDEIGNSFESFGDFGDFQSADGVDTDFEPFAIGTSHDRHDSTSLSPGALKNTSTNIPAVGHHVSDNADEDEGDDSSLALTPTSGSWTIANGYDGFEEITRI